MASGLLHHLTASLAVGNSEESGMAVLNLRSLTRMLSCEEVRASVPAADLADLQALSQRQRGVTEVALEQALAFVARGAK